MARGIPKVVLEKLHAVPLFSGCNAKELRQIANLGARLNVRDGTVLTKQGKPGREFFLLLDGAARCLVDGNQVTTFGSGDFFGEMALLDRGPRHATVVAEGPIEVLVLYAGEFDSLMDASPSITRKLLAALAERARANATPRT
jgi:CRP-like cAMP-binding protein